MSSSDDRTSHGVICLLFDTFKKVIDQGTKDFIAIESHPGFSFSNGTVLELFSETLFGLKSNSLRLLLEWRVKQN